MGSFQDQSHNSWHWNINTTSTPRGRSLSELHELNILMSSVSPRASMSDSISWMFKPNGFSTSSAYAALNQQIYILDKDMISSIWLKWILPRVQVFCWKLAHDVLPTKYNLLIRGIITPEFDPICSLCNGDIESQDHLFVSCPATRSLWLKILYWWNLPFSFPEKATELLQQSNSITTHGGINHLFQISCICVLWSVWYARNNLQFNALPWDAESLLNFIQSRSFAWIKGNGPPSTFHYSDWLLYPMQVEDGC